MIHPDKLPRYGQATKAFQALTRAFELLSYISLYLPIYLPYISVYLRISPYISLYPGARARLRAPHRA